MVHCTRFLSAYWTFHSAPHSSRPDGPFSLSSLPYPSPFSFCAMHTQTAESSVCRTVPVRACGCVSSVSTRVCMCLHVCVCVFTRVSVCSRTCVCVCVRAAAHACVHACVCERAMCMCVCVSVCACLHACVNVCMHVCACMCVLFCVLSALCWEIAVRA